MARDVRDFKVPETVIYEGPTGSSIATVNRQSVKSSRSDAVSTSRSRDGTYHDVTGYSAYFLLTSSHSGEANWKTATSKYRLYWTGGEVHSSVWNAGCTSLGKPSIPLWCLSQVRAQMHRQCLEDIDVSQLVGEANKTVSSLASIFGALVEMFRAFRHGSWNAFVSSTISDVRRNGKGRTAAQAYLAWIYGFKPLISDAQRIMDNWDKVVDEPVGRPLFAEVKDSGFAFPVKKGFTYSGKLSRGVSSGAYAYVTNPQNLKYSQLGLTSPLSVAWELTTLSFVVDWFFHIGAFLRTWEGTMGVGIQDYWETQWVDNAFTQYEDRYEAVYASKFNSPVPPVDKMEVYVRLKAMFRQNPPFLLPSPPYFSWGVKDASRALSVFALFLARSRPVWQGDPARVTLYNTWLRGIT